MYNSGITHRKTHLRCCCLMRIPLWNMYGKYYTVVLYNFVIFTTTVERLSARLSLRENCWVLSTVTSNLIRAAIKCNTCRWKQKRMTSALSDSPDETGYNQNQMLNNRTVYICLYFRVRVSCSLIYLLKGYFQTRHTSQTQNTMYSLICFGAKPFSHAM